MVYNYSYALYSVESQIDKQTGPYRGVCRVLCAQGPRPCQGPLATENNRTSRLKYCMLTASCEILFYSFHKEDRLMFKQKNYAGRRLFILNKKIYVSLKKIENKVEVICVKFL